MSFFILFCACWTLLCSMQCGVRTLCVHIYIYESVSIGVWSQRCVYVLLLFCVWAFFVLKLTFIHLAPLHPLSFDMIGLKWGCRFHGMLKAKNQLFWHKKNVLIKCFEKADFGIVYMDDFFACAYCETAEHNKRIYFALCIKNVKLVK